MIGDPRRFAWHNAVSVNAKGEMEQYFSINEEVKALTLIADMSISEVYALKRVVDNMIAYYHTTCNMVFEDEAPYGVKK